MRLTQRQKDIIRILSQKKKEMTSDQILYELNCSLRTLRNEIQAINRAAKGNLVRSSNKGYFLDRSLLETQPITADAAVQNDVYQILNSLIEKEELDFYELADSLHLSESALQRRLKTVAGLLSEHQLSLSVKNNRVQISGKEYDKCKFIRFLIMEESSPAFLNLESCSAYFPNMDVAFAKRIIMDAISEYQYYIEGCYAENLNLNVIIVLSRIRKGYHMEPLDPDLLTDDAVEIVIASRICTLYAVHYPEFSFSAEDVRYIAMLLSGQAKPQIGSSAGPSSFNNEFKNTISDILLQTFNYYMLNIDYESFLSSFLLHMCALFRRSATGQYLQDITVENLKSNCPFIYDVAVYLCRQLEQTFSVHIPDAEIGYIAIHIGFAIENVTKEDTKVKILLICSDYHDSGRKIMEKLRAYHENEAEIVCVLNQFNQKKLQENADMIITTFPVEAIVKQVVTISPFYTSMDEMQVSQAIKQCQAEKEKKRNRNLLLNCFHDKLFFIDDTIRTKEEAIRFLGNKIEAFGLAPEGFTDSVMQRERISSTCFFNAFAIPHALEMNAKRTMFSVLISRNGILWENNIKIPIVLMITANQNDRKEFMKIYSSIIRYLWDKENAFSVAKVNSFTEFLDFFRI